METVELPVLPSVTSWPLTVAPAATLPIGVLGMPATALPGSGLMTIESSMVTVSMAVAQFGGVLLSQSWYCRL
jgi:hypothetical protein